MSRHYVNVNSDYEKLHVIRLYQIAFFFFLKGLEKNITHERKTLEHKKVNCIVAGIPSTY